MVTHPLKEIIYSHKQDNEKGIYSVCSANKFVLEAAMLQAKKDRSFLLIESTSNQVNQFGGYTGMTPDNFHDFVLKVAEKMLFPTSSLILGGDHLGPNVWSNQSPVSAMELAKNQIAAYAESGFTKIHLDASMPLKGDSVNENGMLDPELVAKRTAELCFVSEKAFSKKFNNGIKSVYIIGSDVPIPGGAKGSLDDIRITPVGDVKEILEATKRAFEEKELNDAWERVVAVVVQPGVEFGDRRVVDYDPLKATDLKAFIEKQPQIVFEAHSTDYQMPESLKKMVEDHFVILKVGPWLTYAFREAIFALSYIETELLPLHEGVKASGIIQNIEKSMLKNPEYWIKHYRGNEQEKAFSRKYSFSDRIRYYWSKKEVAQSLDILINNLRSVEIPSSLISQFLPIQYEAIRNGEIDKQPEMLIHHKIREILTIYSFATKMKRIQENKLRSERTHTATERI